MTPEILIQIVWKGLENMSELRPRFTERPKFGTPEFLSLNHTDDEFTITSHLAFAMFAAAMKTNIRESVFRCHKALEGRNQDFLGWDFLACRGVDLASNAFSELIVFRIRAWSRNK